MFVKNCMIEIPTPNAKPSQAKPEKITPKEKRDKTQKFKKVKK